MNETWRRSRADRLFDMANIVFFCILLLVILYPLYFIIIASISDPDAVNQGLTFLLPKDITFEGYKSIFQDARIWQGFMNSFVYMIVGTIIKLSLTITAGYALSRHDLIGRNFFMMMIVFTMFFQGGLIPTYLLVQGLGIDNSLWAMVLPGAVNVFQLIIARTFFQFSIPEELREASFIDGCSNWKFFFKIVIPLSMPIIAVVGLFSAVGEWNAYFPALVYLRDEALHPLQLILRSILIQSEAQSAMLDDSLDAQLYLKAAEQIKYGVIIVASLPMLILYPFVQKYFVHGVMIGSVKG
ncbi:carbohydrate ABC transporter permease [Bacillaceae bacterium SIJ1]|uniref:carbohydrate ABC transporter permease n=1 Tax=Litoribacterium kuwaitense TaxID=1398745 RepID=UPI0013EB3371|nr:carbohydrate ABC transporter permease [Litoribacterium kuwaitense]NGP45437.1 carbohydrate ABC transporter permease [Litoribacterium kuwaitense]